MFFSHAKRSRVLIRLGVALILIAPALPAASDPQSVASPPLHDRHITLDPVVFTPAAPGQIITKTVSGVIKPVTALTTPSLANPLLETAPDWVYLPVDVPAGVNQISVSYSYDRPTVPPGALGNAMDIGVFDQRGIQLGSPNGFRGWSGGARDSFFINQTEATPGYLPGPVSPGRWHVIFGPYTVASQGLNWTANVTLSYGPLGPPFVPNPAPDKANGRGNTWYRGDVHLHTVYSDGKYLPAEIVSGSTEAGLDFIVSTEHNTSSADGIWGNYRQPNLLILNGEEITTRNGHYNALGLPHGTWIDWRYRATDDDAFEYFVNQIHQSGGLAVANHPYCSYIACFWKFGYADVDAIEVWNGPWSSWNVSALADWDNQLVAYANHQSTRWIPAIGASDAHREGQVIGLPQDVVFADDLNRNAILNGFRRGQLWIAESSKVNLSFSASGANSTAGIGGRLAVVGNQDVTVTLTVSGVEGCKGQKLSAAEETALQNDAELEPEINDEPVVPGNFTETPSGCSVRIISDEGQILETPLPESGTGTVSLLTSPDRSRYVRAEVRRVQNDPVIPTTMVAFTNPIFLGQ
ncbi:MAG: PHP domain-containing protein [Acidobacteriaceae bacterium]|nr:PHP domain-containing protein [Acidobacteriaceae bacterium]